MWWAIAAFFYLCIGFAGTVVAYDRDKSIDHWIALFIILLWPVIIVAGILASPFIKRKS